MRSSPLTGVTGADEPKEITAATVRHPADAPEVAAGALDCPRSSNRGARLGELGAARVLPDVETAVAPFDIGIDSVGGATTYLDSTHTEAEDLVTLVRLVATGRLHPEIGLVDDWSRTGDAIVALLNREVRGNVVLTID